MPSELLEYVSLYSLISLANFRLLFNLSLIRSLQKLLRQKKYSSRLSRQLGETNSNKKIGLKITPRLLSLECNKPNKQNVYEIIYFQNSTFLSLKIIVDTD